MEIFNWLSNNEFITDYKILEYWTKPNECKPKDPKTKLKEI